ncbi:hypothetical protein RPMA_18220 [Tardiphaga alba]|uniref:DUF1049 domain-containing protein n=1 Tax=Tardiphaga alba TaxID=340268 RepID=A0ABX8AAF1_9BRAD|nr:hypothetical protein [Tardiphaga alba]QUS40554.1 hypothetical protein RPMA_18220 [Tardiphaga alba]
MGKSPSGLSANAAERVELLRVDQRYKTLRTLLRCCLGGVAFHYLHDSIFFLAGETTKLAFELAVLADFKFAITLTLAGCAAGWAVVERSLRYRKVEYFQKRIRELETGIDPSRSSSGLTPKGKTHPGDK